MNKEILEKVLTLKHIPPEIDIGKLVIFASDCGLLGKYSKQLANIVYDHLYKKECTYSGGLDFGEVNIIEKDDIIGLSIGEQNPTIIPLVYF